MAKASTLIQRTGGSQDPSLAQTWVIQATSGTTFTVGFDKEFVKKHLFVDPKDIDDLDARAQGIVDKINRYKPTGMGASAVPAVLDPDILRFLKLKKLVLSRVAQGTCGVCGADETQHALICGNCTHAHAKPWGGFACGDGGCTCTAYVKARGGRTTAPVCAKFQPNLYQRDRTAVAKPNPFGGSGGACTGTNSVLLMDRIDLQAFKDVVVGAIQAEENNGWALNEKKEGAGIAFDFGAMSNVAVTVQSGDTWDTFRVRAAGRGIKVYARKAAGPIYRVYHFHEVIG